MPKCVYCDQHFRLCHNRMSEVFLRKCPNQNKSCIFFISRDSTNKKAKSCIRELDWTKGNNIHFVHVFWHTSGCFTNKHKRTDYLAKVLKDDDDEIVELRIFYCHKCETYYANGNLLPEKDILVHMKNTHLFNMPSGYYDYYDMSPQSILRKNGYSARSGSVPYERHRVLDHVIENGILTPYQIINHLGGLIDWHYGDPKWKNAVSNWKEDLNYVQDIDVEEHNGRFKILHKKR